MNIIDKSRIDDAIRYYNIDDKYKKELYDCANQINSNEKLNNRFFEIYNVLMIDQTEGYRVICKNKNSDVYTFFENGTSKCITNLMLLMGFEAHEKNMNKMHFDNSNKERHKKAIKDLFWEDMEIKKFPAIRLSLMLWGVYYIRCDLVYIGRLQFQKFEVKDNKCIVKIHIPREGKLDYEQVLKSINIAKTELKKYFGNYDFEYICNSWLLSNQIYEIVDEESNIAKFRNLFDINDRENCLEDLLFFVFNRGLTYDFSELPENTSLQKKIKKELLNGKVFYLGTGIKKGREKKCDFQQVHQRNNKNFINNLNEVETSSEELER